VPCGGKSWGRYLQGIPVRLRYRIALKISLSYSSAACAASGSRVLEAEVMIAMPHSMNSSKRLLRSVGAGQQRHPTRLTETNLRQDRQANVIIEHPHPAWAAVKLLFCNDPEVHDWRVGPCPFSGAERPGFRLA
jgi:hypothetical protein